MSHIRTILDNKGSCSATKIIQAKGYADQLMDQYDGQPGEPPEGYHALLERVQDLFTAVCDGTVISQGAINSGLTLDSVIEEMETMLGI